MMNDVRRRLSSYASRPSRALSAVRDRRNSKRQRKKSIIDEGNEGGGGGNIVGLRSAQSNESLASVLVSLSFSLCSPLEM